MKQFIEAIVSDPLGTLSLVVAFAALAVACVSARIARRSHVVAEESLANSRRALHAEHLPNIEFSLRFESHNSDDSKHLYFFFRNRGMVPANDVETVVTFSLGESSTRREANTKERAEPGESWTGPIQKQFQTWCAKLAPEIFKVTDRGGLKILPGVQAPTLSIRAVVRWSSPAVGVPQPEATQLWDVSPEFDDLLVKGWVLKFAEEEPWTPPI